MRGEKTHGHIENRSGCRRTCLSVRHTGIAAVAVPGESESVVSTQRRCKAVKTDEKSTLYLCDPQKIQSAKKELSDAECCFLTTRKEFAVTDENENPINCDRLPQKQPSRQ